MNRTIISVSGYGDTGASAVIDILKGFKSIETFDDFELQLHYFPDGISDLDYALNESCNRFYDSDVAINRFLELCKQLDRWYEPAFHGQLHKLAEEYIDSLNPVKWNGYWAFDRLYTPKEKIEQLAIDNTEIQKKNTRRQFINRFFRRIKLPQLKILEFKQYKDLFQCRQMYMCAKPENFYQKTQEFSEKIVDIACKTEASIKVLNMLLPPNNPIRYQKYFTSNVKSIVVTRDPRDLYVHLKYYKWRVLPFDTVETFIHWYKETFKKENNVCDDSILRLNFEDLVFNLDKTISRISDFIGVYDYSKEKSKFDPNVSAINTKSFALFPQYQDDIKTIEAGLSEYLYDFSAHDVIHCTTDTIF